MPPKQKIKKEALLGCAYRICQEQGIAAVTSRSVAKAAGCSIQPVFSHFPTMEALRQATFDYACQRFMGEVLVFEKEPDFPARVSKWTLDLARFRPNLYKLLYLSDGFQNKSMGDMMMNFESNRKMVSAMSAAYGLTEADCESILVRSCLMLMGISTMICVNHMDISDQQALGMIRQTVEEMIEGKRRK